MIRTMKQTILSILLVFGFPSLLLSAEIQQGEMAGYLLVPNERVPESYNAGFSMYVAAWPLLEVSGGSFSNRPVRHLDVRSE